MRVFVSYTLKDPDVTKEKLEQLEAQIKPFSTVFIDLLHNKRGNQLRVNRELSRCDAVLQVVSPDYESEWVKKELLMAQKKGKPIIQVRLDDVLEENQEKLYRLLGGVKMRDCWLGLCC